MSGTIAADELRAWYTADLGVPCVHCRSEVGAPCCDDTGGALVDANGRAIVHFARRVRRIVQEKRPDLLDKPS